MEVLYFAIPMALLIGGGFVWAFVWATRSGQFDDLETPALRILFQNEAGEGKRGVVKPEAIEGAQPASAHPQVRDATQRAPGPSAPAAGAVTPAAQCEQSEQQKEE